MYHKAESHKYNRALCGADVHWINLAMNDDVVECKRCKRLQGTQDKSKSLEKKDGHR